MEIFKKKIQGKQRLRGLNCFNCLVFFEFIKNNVNKILCFFLSFFYFYSYAFIRLIKSDNELTKLLEESNMFDKTKNQYKTQKSDAIQKLKNIIEFNNKNEKLINVFRLDSEDSGQDIELTILRAFLNGLLLFSS